MKRHSLRVSVFMPRKIIPWDEMEAARNRRSKGSPAFPEPPARFRCTASVRKQSGVCELGFKF